MRSFIITVAFLSLFSNAASARTTPIPEESIDCQVTRYYKHRKDNSAGRETFVTYNGVKPLKNACIEIVAGNKTERTQILTDKRDSIPILLPPEVGVSKDDTILVNLLAGKKILASKQVIVPYSRQWTVYIYPHSHVDIGYTNTQANVELIHKRNLEVAIELAEKTKNYPEGARFVWNPEVTWPIERYLNSESKEKCDKLIRAIKDGQISVDASYVHINTCSANDEELFELFSFGKKMEKLTGKRVQTMVQVDIPGLSWGIVPVASQLEIPYCLSFFNGSARVGLSYEINFKPFWWESPDGKSKILFLQPGAYNYGAIVKGYMFWPKMVGQLDPDKIRRTVKTDNPREQFIDSYLDEMLPMLEKADYYPYDIFPMTWSMSDNAPIDCDLPEAVKSWNEEFAYPHLKICTATEIMSTFDHKYGDQIPTLRGDFTEFWIDGLGTKAEFSGRHREVKENLVQTETLWSMLRPNQPTPRTDFEEAWRNTLLGTEHTWTYMEPKQQPISDLIMNGKLDYFRNADKMQKELFAYTIADITEDSETISLFNTSSWTRSEVVRLSQDISKNYTSVIDAETNKPVPSQRLSTDELIFWAENVEGMDAKKYRLSTKSTGKTTAPMIKGYTLDNGIVQVKLSPETGDVISLIYEGEEFADSKSVCALNSYRYLKGDDDGSRTTKAYNVKISIKEQGPLVNSLLVESDAEGCNKLIREVSITAGQPYVSFYNVVDKIAITDKEGVHFGFAFDLEQPVIHADLPWGVMEVEKDQLPGSNKNWLATQRWLNLSDKEKNVTWCSLNSCLFEVGEMSANIMDSATESPEWIREIKPSGTIYSWVMNNYWNTNFALSQDGMIRFSYCIQPAKGSYNPAKANRFGMEQTRPMIAVPVNKAFEYSANMQLSGDETVAVSIVKTVDEGKAQIVRLRSVSDKDQKVRLTWKTKKPKHVFLCMTGEEASEKQLANGEVTVPAMGMVTIRLEW